MAERGLGARVKFTGYVRPEDMAGLYSLATVFAYPSLYEGFGLPVLEAMACGTPVLTSNVSALPEVAGDAALLVDPYDTRAISAGLGALDRDAALRDRLSHAGLAQAERFSVARYQERLTRLYEEVSDQYNALRGRVRHAGD